MTYNTTYLLLGSNEGDRMGWLQQAVKALSRDCGIIDRTSSVYQTAAWGITDQPAFLNMVVQLSTLLQPLQLLAAINDIENQLGRQRSLKWGQRTLDIDILLYNYDLIDLPTLTVPHPFMQDRRFTLVPLCEIAAGYIHPKLHMTVAGLLSVCPDKLEVEKVSNLDF